MLSLKKKEIVQTVEHRCVYKNMLNRASNLIF